MSRTKKRSIHIIAIFTKNSYIFLHLYEKKNKGCLDCASEDSI